MTKLRFLAAVLTLFLVAAACTPSDDDPVETSGGTESTETETTTADESEPTAIPDEPAEDEPADSGDTSEPEDEPAPEETVELTASWRGVDETSITVGISMLDFGILADLGLVPAGWGDQQLVWETYIDELNARGGINGRELNAVYSFYSPLGTEPAETSCVELTEDVESFAVLGGFLGPAQTVNTCITAIHDTILINGVMTQETLAEATAPWVQAAALAERSLDLMLGLLEAEGMLEGRKIVIVGSLEKASVAEGATALLEARGVTPVRYIVNDVPQGEIQAENDAWAVFAERIAADGADTVLVIGAGQAAFRGIFNAGLDVEIWNLDITDLSSLGLETSKEMADGVITITGMTDQERWEHDETVKCREIFSAANPDVEMIAPDDLLEDQESWFNPIINYCAWLRIFELLATAAGPDLTHDTFAAAIEGLTDFSAAGIPFASFGPGKFDAGDAFRLGIFDPDASDAGDVVALTDILDATP